MFYFHKSFFYRNLLSFWLIFISFFYYPIYANNQYNLAPSSKFSSSFSSPYQNSSSNQLSSKVIHSLDKGNYLLSKQSDNKDRTYRLYSFSPILLLDILKDFIANIDKNHIIFFALGVVSLVVVYNMLSPKIRTFFQKRHVQKNKTILSLIENSSSPSDIKKYLHKKFAPEIRFQSLSKLISLGELEYIEFFFNVDLDFWPYFDQMESVLLKHEFPQSQMNDFYLQFFSAPDVFTPYFVKKAMEGLLKNKDDRVIPLLVRMQNNKNSMLIIKSLEVFGKKASDALAKVAENALKYSFFNRSGYSSEMDEFSSKMKAMEILSSPPTRVAEFLISQCNRSSELAELSFSTLKTLNLPNPIDSFSQFFQKTCSLSTMQGSFEALQALSLNPKDQFELCRERLSKSDDDAKTPLFKLISSIGNSEVLPLLIKLPNRKHFSEYYDCFVKNGASKDEQIEVLKEIFLLHESEAMSFAIQQIDLLLGNDSYSLLSELILDEKITFETFSEITSLFQKYKVSSQRVRSLYLDLLNQTMEKSNHIRDYQVLSYAIEYLGNSGLVDYIPLFRNILKPSMSFNMGNRVKALSSLLSLDPEETFIEVINLLPKITSADHYIQIYNTIEKTPSLKEKLNQFIDATLDALPPITTLIFLLSHHGLDSTPSEKLMSLISSSLNNRKFPQEMELAIKAFVLSNRAEALPILRKFSTDCYTVKTYNIYNDHGAIIEAEAEEPTPISDVGQNVEFVRSEDRKVSNLSLRAKADSAISSIKENLKLKNISKKKGAAFQLPNKELIKKAIKEKRISIEDIADPKLRKFLLFLRKNKLENIVVMGGGVRDIFFGRTLSDFDISVHVDIPQTEHSEWAITTKGGSIKIFNQAISYIKGLAKAMMVPSEHFFLPAGDSKAPSFEGLEIQFAGPIRKFAHDKVFIIKRFICDTNSRRGFSSSSGSSLLQMAIDCHGNLYGNLNSLQHLQAGMIDIIGPLNTLYIGDYMRAFRLKHEFGLEFYPEDFELIKKAIDRDLNRKDLAISPILHKVSFNQAKKILESAQNPDLARKELSKLGIFELLDKVFLENLKALEKKLLKHFRKNNKQIHSLEDFVEELLPFISEFDESIFESYNFQILLAKVYKPIGKRLKMASIEPLKKELILSFSS